MCVYLIENEDNDAQVQTDRFPFDDSSLKYDKNEKMLWKKEVWCVEKDSEKECEG